MCSVFTLMERRMHLYQLFFVPAFSYPHLCPSRPVSPRCLLPLKHLVTMATGGRWPGHCSESVPPCLSA